MQTLRLFFYYNKKIVVKIIVLNFKIIYNVNWRESMAISKVAKLEIIKKRVFKNELRSLVQGMILSAGNLIISNGELSFAVSNENEEVIELLKTSLENLFEGIEIDIVKVVKNFKNKERFELSVVGEGNERVLKGISLVSEKNGEVKISELCDKSFLKSESSMTAFLIGMFLGSGTLSAPNLDEKHSYGYHLDISVSSIAQAEMISEIISNFDIFPKTVERNDQFVVYLKNCDLICDLLGVMGASKVVLELQSQRVTRDVSNNTNRQINCISANIDKAVDAALKQLKAIEIIQNTIGIENLPDVLSEAALSRLANPEGSLSELLQTLDTKITKGALAQRFNKIIKIAEELSDEK